MKLQCSKCRIIKDEDEFYKQNGKNVMPCKTCKKAAVRNAVYEGDPNHPIVRHKRGRPKKIVTYEGPCYQELPMKKDEPYKALHVNEKIVHNQIYIMDVAVFHKAISLAYEKGKLEGKEFDALFIEESSLETKLNEILNKKGGIYAAS